MKIRMSIHAQIRSIERGIDVDTIKRVIRTPDSSENQFEGRVKAVKIIDDRSITVIYTIDKNVFVIITTI
ncbi:DUF4258 domain-containing protein [Candidatus Nomurabacteria bacterium]|nr:DUF4258 domain-containing protein [Candidatus Kaiserbacteria bacterium]MCB9814185.1 DUF4258 domain-containing protein [Candidatus Nomurabacteria bacterium]